VDELLAELIADPSPDRFSVYADALQQRNDPRGELIALDLYARATNTPRAPRADEIERDLEAKLLDGLDGKFTIRWEHGFVRDIMVPSDTIYPLAERFAVEDFAMLRRIRVAPMGPFREETVLQCQPIELLVNAPFSRTLEHVAIGAPAMALVRAGELERLITSLPRLTGIELRSNTPLDETRLAVLERFTRIEALAVWGVGGGDLLARVVDMPWPNLRSLVLEPPTAWQHAFPAALEPVLDGAVHPHLVELALIGQYGDALPRAIIERPLGRRLRSLGLSLGSEDNERAFRDRMRHVDLYWPAPPGYRPYSAISSGRSQLLRRLGRPAQALGHAMTACEVDPRDHFAWQELATVYEMLGDEPAAAAARDRATAVRPPPLVL
jgi:hypothetical protein